MSRVLRRPRRPSSLVRTLWGWGGGRSRGFPRMHGGSWGFAGVFRADEGGIILTSSGSRRPTRSFTCFAQNSPAEWREGRGRRGRRERQGVSVEKSRRVGPADCFHDCPDYKLPGLSRRRWPLSEAGSDIISAGPPPGCLREGLSRPGSLPDL